MKNQCIASGLLFFNEKATDADRAYCKKAFTDIGYETGPEIPGLYAGCCSKLNVEYAGVYSGGKLRQALEAVIPCISGGYVDVSQPEIGFWRYDFDLDAGRWKFSEELWEDKYEVMLSSEDIRVIRKALSQYSEAAGEEDAKRKIQKVLKRLNEAECV